MRDRRVRDFTDEEVLERVEAAAATGNRRAALILRSMVEERQRTGEIEFLSRLAASPYLFGDRHGRH